MGAGSLPALPNTGTTRPVQGQGSLQEGNAASVWGCDSILLSTYAHRPGPLAKVGTVENTTAVRRLWCYGLLPLSTGPAGCSEVASSQVSRHLWASRPPASTVTHPLAGSGSEAVTLQGFSRDKCPKLTDETRTARGTGNPRDLKGHLLSFLYFLDFLEHGL